MSRALSFGEWDAEGRLLSLGPGVRRRWSSRHAAEDHSGGVSHARLQSVDALTHKYLQQAKRATERYLSLENSASPGFLQLF